jgi:hypothetical protein
VEEFKRTVLKVLSVVKFLPAKIRITFKVAGWAESLEKEACED